MREASLQFRLQSCSHQRSEFERDRMEGLSICWEGLLTQALVGSAEGHWALSGLPKREACISERQEKRKKKKSKIKPVLKVHRLPSVLGFFSLLRGV